ncbi:MAG: SDR family oxidoreductase [Desulfobacter sp.]|nr:MAG: SDR family oxidoreductase [Desulfobacter sp.]
MNTFSGKTVYITGGSSGIGLATAKHLAGLGADILLMARQTPPLERAKQALETSRRTPDQQFHTLSLDVTDQNRVYEEMAAAVEKTGPPDILILSAGINTAADHFENIDHTMFNRVMDVNVNGVRNLAHALAGPMKTVKGHVVILSSAAALFGMYGYTAYAASKAALMGFAESLRYELKPNGMAVTIVFPPDVNTPMNDAEAKTLPVQGRAMKKMAGLLTPEFTAGEIVKAIERKTYFAIPGRLTRFLYFLHRITNGAISRMVSDILIRRASGEIQ